MSVSVLAAGCAAPPNTPGAGYGATYTPVIDLTGVDGGRYAADLDACRQLSKQVDAQREQMNAGLTAAILGAGIMAAVGGSARQIDQTASGAFIGGTARGGGRAMGRQESIIGNCMAGRGYRVLDGTANVAINQFAAPVSRPPVPAALPAQAQGDGSTVAIAAPAAAPAAPVPAVTPVSVPRPVMPAKVAAPAGQFGYEAAKFAREQRCAAFDTPAQFVAKGAGFESYSVACTSGDVMMVRCEFGTCRALR